MKDEETRLLGVRSSAAAWLSRALFAALAAGALVALALVGFWLQGTSRHARALEQARHDLGAANAQLEGKVAARTAELLETNEEIQRFAYIVSHDLRAPLVNIMGFTSELEATRQDVAAALVDNSQVGSDRPRLCRGARLHSGGDLEDGRADRRDPEDLPRGATRVPARAARPHRTCAGARRRAAPSGG